MPLYTRSWPAARLLPRSSRRRGGLPYSGYYSLYFHSNNILNLIYDGPEISSNYWPDPFKRWWENNRTAYNSSRYGSLDRRGAFSADAGLRRQPPAVQPRRRRRELARHVGRAPAAVRRARCLWPLRRVRVPAAAGAGAGAGVLVPGGVRGPRGDWSKGCRREFHVRCGEPVYFVEMPSFDFNYTPGVLCPWRRAGICASMTATARRSATG